jgi:ferredoxin
MPNRGPLRLATALIVIAICALLAQAAHNEPFPGSYPAFEGPIEPSYAVNGPAITMTLPAWLEGMRVMVYAYDEHGQMFGVMKPVINNTVTVTHGDYADVEIRIKGRQVKDFELLKRMDHYLRQVDMHDLFADAQANGRNHGIQRCLYPLCTRCLDACKSVINGGDIPLQMEVGPGGQIHPVYARGKCPRCGKCFTWCPVQVITNSRTQRD